MRITKRIEFDYGHRIPYHNSKCRSPHGHRAVLEITVEGDIKPIRNQSDDGMVIDFSEIKALASALVGDKWDHAFLVWEGDTSTVYFLLQNKFKCDILPVIPTAENLVELAYDMLEKAYLDIGLTLSRVRFYETPNSWADAGKDD